MSPSLTRGFLGGFCCSTSGSESESCSASASGTSSTLSEASGISPTLSESGLDSALTTKVGLAMRGLQRHEIEDEETLAINGKLREPRVEALQEEEKPSLVGEH